MQNTIETLEKLITGYTYQLKLLDSATFSYKPDPEKWSKKEILGHLIDSAQSNIRRFIIAQYEDNPKIGYNQNEWVTASGYQQYDQDGLIGFWILINKHICHILKNMPAGKEKRNCTTGEEHTIEWLAEDYIKHLQHHMHVILNLEPVAYP
jgi:hypothetical protein